MVEMMLRATSPFHGILHNHGIDARGVIVTDHSGRGVVSVLTPLNGHAALREAVKSGFGLELPDRPRRVGAKGLAFVGTCPGRYLAMGNTVGLSQKLGPLAHVIDQSAAYGILRLSGPAVRSTLSKGLSVDLHPDAFPVGAALSSAVAHIGVHFWRLDDNGDGAPVFEIASPRSMARSFWHFLSLSAAEFGLIVERNH